MDLKAFQSKYEHKPVIENINSVPKNPMLSVCVQTYQHVDFIEACLEGILQQKTNFEFEILLGEDASSDGTREICKKYAKQYPDKIRLFLHHRENNIKIGGSPTGRFNFVYNLFSARGKYIALCEGDDYWTDPLKLQKQVDFLEAHEDYLLCFHPCEILTPISLKKQQLSKIDYNYNIQELLEKWGIPTASMVFRNNFVFPEWFCNVASGDIALAMLLFEKGKFKLLREYMSVYRVEGQGVSVLHKGYRMIHYRAKLYSNLNEYFDYKYEKDIYDALAFIYDKFSKAQQPKKTLTLEEVSIKTHLQVVLKKLKQKLL